MPSFVTCVSLLVAVSRAQRLLSRMKTERFLSGEIDSPRPPPNPPPPRPPLPPRPPPVGAEFASATHLLPCTSHFQRRPLAVTVTLCASAEKSRSLKGSRRASNVVPAAALTAEANLV